MCIVKVVHTVHGISYINLPLTIVYLQISPQTPAMKLQTTEVASIHCKSAVSSLPWH